MMKPDFIKTNNPARVCSFFILATLKAGLKRGKSIPSVLFILTATWLSGCSTIHPHHDYSGIPATNIVVTITCSEPKTRFDGTIVCDGVSQLLSGVGSGSFSVSGHEFFCSFRKLDTPGSIAISVSEAGHSLGNSSTEAPSGGVRAEIFRTPLQYHTLFTTL